jgi:hypothetical protein
MTLQAIMDKARYFTRTTVVNYSDADLKSNINTYLHYFVNEILESMDGWGFGETTNLQSLVASQQGYTFPTGILKIKRVEISYDGTNWKEAQPFDINMRNGANDTTTIGQDFSKDNPFYDASGTTLNLYPIPDTAVTDGLKIWYEKEATELSAASDEPTFAEAYHKALAYGAAKDYFQKRKKYVESKTMDNEMNNLLGRMKIFYNRRIPDDNFVGQIGATNYE